MSDLEDKLNNTDGRADDFINSKTLFPQFHVLRTDWRNDKDLEAAANFLLHEAAEAERQGITIPNLPS